MIKYIRKRDGRMDQFDVNKIAGAIYKAFQATEAKYDLDTAIAVAQEVEEKLEAIMQNVLVHAIVKLV